jgi:hypothetical protein
MGRPAAIKRSRDNTEILAIINMGHLLQSGDYVRDALLVWDGTTWRRNCPRFWSIGWNWKTEAAQRIWSWKTEVNEASNSWTFRTRQSHFSPEIFALLIVIPEFLQSEPPKNFPWKISRQQRQLQQQQRWKPGYEPVSTLRQLLANTSVPNKSRRGNKRMNWHETVNNQDMENRECDCGPGYGHWVKCHG